MEARLETLECKLMDAEDQLDELNRTIFRQQQRIERLERELVDLKSLVLNRMPDQQRRLEDEIPPHY